MCQMQVASALAFFRIKLLVFEFFLSYSDLALIAIQTMRLLTLYADRTVVLSAAHAAQHPLEKDLAN